MSVSADAQGRAPLRGCAGALAELTAHREDSAHLHWEPPLTAVLPSTPAGAGARGAARAPRRAPRRCGEKRAARSSQLGAADSTRAYAAAAQVGVPRRAGRSAWPAPAARPGPARTRTPARHGSASRALEKRGQAGARVLGAPVTHLLDGGARRGHALGQQVPHRRHGWSQIGLDEEPDLFLSLFCFLREEERSRLLFSSPSSHARGDAMVRPSGPRSPSVKSYVLLCACGTL